MTGEKKMGDIIQFPNVTPPSETSEITQQPQGEESGEVVEMDQLRERAWFDSLNVAEEHLEKLRREGRSP